jgi:hypothetical protein
VLSVEATTEGSLSYHVWNTLHLWLSLVPIPYAVDTKQDPVFACWGLSGMPWCKVLGIRYCCQVW